MESMTNEDAVRAVLTALGEVADLMRRAFLSTDSLAPEPDADYEGIYVRQQLDRIKEQAEWLRDHLQDLADPEFVRWQAERMVERDKGATDEL